MANSNEVVSTFEQEMKKMLQLVSPTDGKIIMFGKDHRKQVKDTYQKIGSIIETHGFYMNLTGRKTWRFLHNFVNMF